MHEVFINKTGDFATVDATNLFWFFSSYKDHQVAPPKKILNSLNKVLVEKRLNLQQYMPLTSIHFVNSVCTIFIF